MNPAGVRHMEMDDLGGAVGGTLGGVVSWLRSEIRGWRGFFRIALSGLICGVTSFFVVRWQFPDVPWGVNVGFSALAGVASSAIIELFLSLVNKASIVIQKLLDSWLAHLEQKHGPPPPAAGAAGHPAGPPAVVVGDRVPAGVVPGVDGGQRVAEGKAERPTPPAG